MKKIFYFVLVLFNLFFISFAFAEESSETINENIMSEDTAEETAIPYSGEIKTVKNVLKGDYLEVFYKFVDEKGVFINIENTSDIVITTSDPHAVIVDNRITFNTPGIQKIYVTYKTVTTINEVKVADDIASIYIYPEEISLKKGETVNLTVTVWDQEGNVFDVHPESVNWVSDGVPVKSGVLEYGQGYVGVEFENATAYCSVNGGRTPDRRYSYTKFMTDVPMEGQIIRISGGCGKYSTIANLIRLLSYEYSLAGADELYMFKDPIFKNMNYHKVNSYSEQIVENTRVVTIDSSSESTFIEQLSVISEIYGIKEKNLIIITERAPVHFSEMEKNKFDGILTKAKEKEKNVFIVYSDSNTHSFFEDGIYYIGCSTVNGSELGYGTDFYNQKKTINFYISKDNIKYSILN